MRVYNETGTDNGVTAVNFATSKNLVVKSIMFPHRKIKKKTLELLLMEKTYSDWKHGTWTKKVHLMPDLSAGPTVILTAIC
jgi:hypothetical protein